MPTKGTTVRAVRIDNELWSAVQDKATADGIGLNDDGVGSVSEAIRIALRHWLECPKSPQKRKA
jgi:hypothetical protein